MSMKTIIPMFCLSLVGFPAMVPAEINYFGVAFSPYVKYKNPDGQYPHWNTYSVEDIKQMLNVVLSNHNSIATYSMGVTKWSKDSPWDQADSNALIARAAAQINKERGKLVLSVAIGVYQNNDAIILDKEVQNAFSAVQDANTIAPGTVWSVTLTNEYVTDPTNAQKVLDMIKNNKARAQSLGVKIGARVNTCWQINGGPLQSYLSQIVQESDFIMCNIYPGNGITDVSAGVQNVNDQYFSARDGILKLNPSIEVIIGETGWPSQGKSFNNDASANTVNNLVEFWNAMKSWSSSNRVRVLMFEAFNEPWKGDGNFPAEKHYGWWYLQDNNQTVYIEKATSKKDGNSELSTTKPPNVVSKQTSLAPKLFATSTLTSLTVTAITALCFAAF